MTKRLLLSAASLGLLASVASADTLTGFNTINADTSDPANVFLQDLTYGGDLYTANVLLYGTTERYYNTATTTALWPEGDPVPADLVPVPGTSNAKVGDVGSHADNNLFSVNASNAGDISSLDGIVYSQTIFASPVTTIFVFERSNASIDPGTVQPILSSDGSSLGTGLTITALQVAGVSTGQNTWGFVYEATDPIWGIQINSSGFDALTITTTPEPTTLSLLGLGLAGLLIARRRS